MTGDTYWGQASQLCADKIPLLIPSLLCIRSVDVSRNSSFPLKPYSPGLIQDDIGELGAGSTSLFSPEAWNQRVNTSHHRDHLLVTMCGTEQPVLSPIGRFRYEIDGAF